jgi:tripartite-type tricarboxylate transporter receptor subunit TctC
LRALAVASAKRAEALPEIPTSAEAGFPQYRSESWFGLIGPIGLSKQLVTRLAKDTERVLNEPATRERILRSGAEPAPTTPEQFAKMQRDEYAELGALIKDISMKVQ